MGRSRTIGADNETAGPPGGPEVRSIMVRMKICQMMCQLYPREGLLGVLLQLRKRCAAPHGGWWSGLAAPAGFHSIRTRLDPRGKYRCW